MTKVGTNLPMEKQQKGSVQNGSSDDSHRNDRDS